MFIVVELQTNEQGQTSNIVTSHSDRNEAESKYHQILSAAATSSVHTHSAILLDERGNLEKSEYYLH